MTLGNMIETVISLALVFLTLAILASATQELIAAVLSSRGKVMKQMLVQLLAEDPKAKDGSALFQRVFGHDLINGIGTTNVPWPLSRLPSAAKLPSYVPARNMSMALIDTLRAQAEKGGPAAAQVRAGIAALPDGAAKRALGALLADADNDIATFSQSVQTWYDDAMDRAAGLYKRNAQYMLLVIGLVLAVGLNVDALHAAGVLWQTPQMRSGAVAAANALVADCTSANPTSKLCPGTKTDAMATFGDAAGSAAKLPVPLGWDAARPTYATNGFVNALCRAVGWLLTALAISLGAPFWFDVVSKFTNARGAGPKPARGDADGS